MEIYFPFILERNGNMFFIFCCLQITLKIDFSTRIYDIKKGQFIKFWKLHLKCTAIKIINMLLKCDYMSQECR